MTDILKSKPDDLSFVERNADGGGYNYWTVEASGDYAADCETGRQLGEDFLAFLGRYPTNGNATLLHCIVNSMIAARRNKATKWGRYTSGVELGFLNAVNEHALGMAVLQTSSEICSVMQSAVGNVTNGASEVSPDLLVLFEAHRNAWARFGEIIEAVERGEVDVTIRDEASAHEEQCIAAIILFPARGQADHRAKGEYLRDMEAHFEDYEDAILAALLSA